MVTNRAGLEVSTDGEIFKTGNSGYFFEWASIDLWRSQVSAFARKQQHLKSTRIEISCKDACFWNLNRWWMKRISVRGEHRVDNCRMKTSRSLAIVSSAIYKITANCRSNLEFSKQFKKDSICWKASRLSQYRIRNPCLTRTSCNLKPLDNAKNSRL